MSYGTLKWHAPEDPWVDRPLWQIEATPDVMTRVKRIFPRVSTYRRAMVTFVDTIEVCRDLQWLLDRYQLDVSPADRKRLDEGAAKHRERQDLVHELLTGARPHFDLVTPARPAREYQLVAADLALATGRLLLADDLGLGKSMSALLTLRDSEMLPALIVCPTHLPRQWERELALTLPWLRAHIIRTGKPYNPARRREMHGHDPDVLIVNYHKLRGWVDHLDGLVRTVIFDEAQELRRVDSEKYKAAARIADSALLRMGLTATPVYNYGGEIHNVLAVLAPDALGTREEFAQQWCGYGGWHDKARVQDPAALGMHLRNEGLMLRRTRKDVGRELPEVVRVPHAIDTDEKVHEQLMAGALDLANVIVNGEDRKQAFVASGDLDNKVRHATGVAKAPYVAEFVRMLLESEQKVVMFGWHRDVYEIWLERLAEFQPALYTGTESAGQKEAAKQRFLAGPTHEDDANECRVLMMSLRSGAGLDGLQEVCNVVVFGELDWSPGMHDQCIGRLHRDGQDEGVVAYFLVSNVGSDPVMADVLNVKRMQSEPMRDPDAEVFETAEDTSNRVRLLAESVLAKRKGARRAPAGEMLHA